MPFSTYVFYKTDLKQFNLILSFSAFMITFDEMAKIYSKVGYFLQASSSQPFSFCVPLMYVICSRVPSAFDE